MYRICASRSVLHFFGSALASATEAGEIFNFLGREWHKVVIREFINCAWKLHLQTEANAVLTKQIMQIQLRNNTQQSFSE